ncbi:hypothetical protein A2U01_0078885, partial [Trifolium medium]|nr:hypothetical protein [Trifolium medium]
GLLAALVPAQEDQKENEQKKSRYRSNYDSGNGSAGQVVLLAVFVTRRGSKW